MNNTTNNNTNKLIEITNNITIIEDKNQIIEISQNLLSNTLHEELVQYIKNNGHELSLSVANKFFTLFLNGSSIEEIHSVNSSFPRAAISWAAIKYNWFEIRNNYIKQLQDTVYQKLIKAQLEITNLYCDILTAASKKHGDKLKKYMQTGNEQDLQDALQINTINQLVKAAEALQKITGQDRTLSVKEEKNININLNTPDLTASDVTDVLKVLADKKRKND